jgi:hypothetical protein
MWPYVTGLEIIESAMKGLRDRDGVSNRVKTGGGRDDVEGR